MRVDCDTVLSRNQYGTKAIARLISQTKNGITQGLYDALLVGKSCPSKRKELFLGNGKS